jgi:hypothetical protein
MKALQNLQWSPKWVSHLGCIKGCLDYLGMDISDAWLYGGTGHAFVINLHETVCPSGPTAWNTSKVFALGKNVGYAIDGVFGARHQGNLAESQKRAWAHVQQAIDQERPCYGWELEIPEFYVVYGYDDVGYYYSGPGCDEGKGPKPWKELGDTGIGAVEMYSISPGTPPDDATTVKEALTFALEHADNPKEWIFEDYAAGLKGFDNWIHAMRAGTASDFGVRYNAGVWLECRTYAVGFLEEAKQRLAERADGLFDKALVHYRAVAESLGKVAEAYPWVNDPPDEPIQIDDNARAAVEALGAAREAEAAGLKTLEQIVQAL